jgi:hypothetical protein
MQEGAGLAVMAGMAVVAVMVPVYQQELVPLAVVVVVAVLAKQADIMVVVVVAVLVSMVPAATAQLDQERLVVLPDQVVLLVALVEHQQVVQVVGVQEVVLLQV